MEWRYFLWVSERLNPGPYSDTDDERIAKTRSGISRAYYAAHNVARLYIHNNKYGGEGLSHEGMWELLEGRDNADEATAGELGQELRIDRNTADYQGGVTARDLREKHRLAIDKAYRICELLKQPWQPAPARKSVAPPTTVAAPVTPRKK